MWANVKYVKILLISYFYFIVLVSFCSIAVWNSFHVKQKKI